MIVEEAVHEVDLVVEEVDLAEEEVVVTVVVVVDRYCCNL